jgi:hypothetical protein
MNTIITVIDKTILYGSEVTVYFPLVPKKYPVQSAKLQT